MGISVAVIANLRSRAPTASQCLVTARNAASSRPTISRRGCRTASRGRVVTPASVATAVTRQAQKDLVEAGMPLHELPEFALARDRIEDRCRGVVSHGVGH